MDISVTSVSINNASQEIKYNEERICERKIKNKIMNVFGLNPS